MADRAEHIVNVSGGKDSSACAILAADRGRTFRLVMADTGNEQQVTIDSAHRLAEFVGVPLEIVRADFSARIAAKRTFVETKWREQGVPEETVQRARAVLVPTGNPFLDLCIWKGRFPSRMAQFCTEELKVNAMEQAIVGPALASGRAVVQWIGVRRDESLNRRLATMFHKVRRDDGVVLLYRPIIHWSAADVFAFLRQRGAPINPLYREGMSRVGCFPCINANKAELAQIGRRFPEAVEKIAEWEAIVADASKRRAATFFAPINGEISQAHEVFRWAKTTRGGRQYDLLGHADDGLSCSSQYGLCE